MKITKRGGIRFVRIGSFQVTLCRVRSKPIDGPQARAPKMGGGAELIAVLLAGCAALAGAVDAFARIGGF